LRLGLSLGAVVCLTGCAGPRCMGPSRGVTPARPVRAPAVTFGGIALDATLEQVQSACANLHGELQTGKGQGNLLFCQTMPRTLSLADGAGPQLLAVRARLDSFGHTKEIEASYLVPDADVASALQGVVANISDVVGDARGGDLAWCGKVPNCDAEAYAEWGFEGGTLRLRSHRDLKALELSLEFSHPDMTEQVIYGLPVCER
jgi:hypothetical protein